MGMKGVGDYVGNNLTNAEASKDLGCMVIVQHTFSPKWP